MVMLHGVLLLAVGLLVALVLLKTKLVLVDEVEVVVRLCRTMRKESRASPASVAGCEIWRPRDLAMVAARKSAGPVPNASAASTKDGYGGK